MAKHHTINLLNPEGRKRKKMFEPTLRLEPGYSKVEMLKIEKVPRELRDHIYRYVFQDHGSVLNFSNISAFRMDLFEASKTEAEKIKMKVDSELKTSFESDMVVDADRAILLYRFPPLLLAELETFIYHECTLKLHCEEELFPRQREVLTHSKRLIIIFRGRPAHFVQNIMPLMKNNRHLKYLRIDFATWPGTMKIAGREAAMMLQRKLDFLTQVRAQNVILEASMPTRWSHPVLSWFSSIMMGDENAAVTNPTADIPIERVNPPIPRFTSNRKVKKEFKTSDYAYVLGKGRVDGVKFSKHTRF